MLVPLHELTIRFSRSSGPGGQNVNKVNSKAIVHWNVIASPSLPPEVKERLADRVRLTKLGEWVVASERYRYQQRNLDDCLEKMQRLLDEVFAPPKLRRPSQPTRRSKNARLQDKHHRSTKKTARRWQKDSNHDE